MMGQPLLTLPPGKTTVVRMDTVGSENDVVSVYLFGDQQPYSNTRKTGGLHVIIIWKRKEARIGQGA